ncbi:MAG: YbdK family carboxylate-amine ligase [Marmoricola sp.]
MTTPVEFSGDFSPGGDFTLGVEDELLLLDASNRLEPSRSDHLVETVRAATRDRPGTASQELFAAQIEFSTGICADAERAVEQLASMRSALAAAGGRALASGLHPAAPLGEAALSHGAHYDQVGHDLAGLLRTPTAALQVHVGLPDERAALVAYRGIRNRLAVLQALSAASPYWHGRDSGMASARWAVISSYPRGGVPPLVRTWEEYAALAGATAAAACTDDPSMVWWDARLRPKLGTIEIRVMDAQPRLAVIAGLAALVQGLVRHEVENSGGIDVPSPVLAENNFRVARHGLDTTITDLEGSHRAVRDLARTALRDARAVLSPDGLGGALEVIEELLAGTPEYARQREVHASLGTSGLVADLVERTEVRVVS